MTALTATRATRILDACKAAYTLHTFAAFDFTAEEAALGLGVPPGEVWKTLVAKGDRTGPLAAVIPTGTRLSLKKLARVSGNRTVALVSPEEMEKLTGYVKGGCSPFGMWKAIPLFAHEAAAGLPRLFVSAGRRGVQVGMSGASFLSASASRPADLVED